MNINENHDVIAGALSPGFGSFRPTKLEKNHIFFLLTIYRNYLYNDAINNYQFEIFSKFKNLTSTI